MKPILRAVVSGVVGLASLYSPNGVTLTNAPKLRLAEDRGGPEPPQDGAGPPAFP